MLDAAKREASHQSAYRAHLIRQRSVVQVHLGPPLDHLQFLFFTRTPNGRQAGKEFLARLEERTNDRDKAISVGSFRAQLKAIHRWVSRSPRTSSIHQPVLVMNGDSDKMVPTKNTIDLDRRLRNSQLAVYSDAGHGDVFQFHEAFVKRALEFF
jgi:pimeloyl-ACP methyl ester carboxylesterase